MTVRELISSLQGMPQDKEVIIATDLWPYVADCMGYAGEQREEFLAGMHDLGANDVAEKIERVEFDPEYQLAVFVHVSGWTV